MINIIYYIIKFYQICRESILNLTGPIFLFRCLKTQRNITYLYYLNFLFGKSEYDEIFIKIISANKTFYATYNGNIDNSVQHILNNYHKLCQARDMHKKNIILMNNGNVIQKNLKAFNTYISTMKNLDLSTDSKYNATILKMLGYPSCTDIKYISIKPVQILKFPIESVSLT